jgi:hypothetical protein
MSQLPNVANATLDDAKITQYLLNSAHSSTAVGKTKFFISFGFSQANWTELKKSLLEHPQTNQVTNHMDKNSLWTLLEFIAGSDYTEPPAPRTLT